MLGGFPKTPFRALEAEAGVLPPPVRLEQLCNRYAARILRFSNNYPIKAITIENFRDELGDSGPELKNNNSLILYITVNIQLITLLLRLRKIVGFRAYNGSKT